MKKNIKKLFVIILTIIIMSIATYSFADVGSFDRYDSGSDWGGSSWSSSDWGSSSSSWDWDDDDYSYSSRSSSSSSSSGGADLGFLIGFLLGTHPGRFVAFILIIAFISAWRKGKYQKFSNTQIPRTNYQTAGNQTAYNPKITKERSDTVENLVKKTDPLFVQEKMLSYTKELFVKLQNAWTQRDWEPMRLFETPELFEQHKSQVQGYIDTNRINVMDRIAVDYAYLYNYRQEEDKEILEIALKSTMKDYIIDATSKKVLEGNPNVDRHTIYKLTFERKKGIVTEKEEEIKTTNCPNCGAPTKITSAGKCEYCGSIIMIGDHGWALANLEPFRD